MIWSILWTQDSMLHDLFTIEVSGKTSGGWIHLMPTVLHWCDTVFATWKTRLVTKSLSCNQHCIGANKRIHIVCTSLVRRLYDYIFAVFGLKHFHHNAGLMEQRQHCFSWVRCLDFKNLRGNKFHWKCWVRAVPSQRKYLEHIQFMWAHHKTLQRACQQYLWQLPKSILRSDQRFKRYDKIKGCGVQTDPRCTDEG